MEEQNAKVGEGEREREKKLEKLYEIKHHKSFWY